jgi:polar amino acid transport system substrate-binding protein
MHSRTRWISAAVPLMCAVAVAGCGSSNSSSGGSATTGAAGAASTTSAAASTTATSAGSSSGTSTSGGGSSSSGASAAAKLVPPSIKSKGTLTVAADASYPPDESFASDGKTVVGMDADLSAAIAKTMGLKAKVVNETFDGIIPGLAAGKYDMGASSFTDTKAREKTVDFVDYYSAGESFFTKASGGVSIGSIADICGDSVAVEKGTTEETDAQAQSKKCTSSGKKAVTVQSYPDQNGANLALSSGRAQLVFADTPPAAYAVNKSHGQFKLVGAAAATAPYGLAIPKKSGLAPAVQASVKALIKNGSYKKILTKWGLPLGGALSVSQVKINGAIS